MLCPFDLLKDNSTDIVKEYLLELAIVKSGGKPIYPVGDKESLADCFTLDENGEWILWYNDSKNDTQIVRQSMDVNKLLAGVKNGTNN